MTGLPVSSGTRPGVGELFKQSFALLRSDKELVLFPVLSAVCSFACVAILFLSYVATLYVAHLKYQKAPFLTYGFVFLYYLVNYYVLMYFSTGLAACVLAMFKGDKPSFRYGMQQASEHRGTILGYALLAATVGLIMNLIESRFRWAGSIFARIIGVAWSIATIFIAPVLVTTKEKSPLAAVKESAEMFKNTWGTTIIGSIGFGLIVVAAVLVFMVPFVLAFVVQNPWLALTLIGLSVIGFLATVIIISTCSAIYRTALFHYAQTKQVPQGFSSNLPLSIRAK